MTYKAELSSGFFIGVTHAQVEDGVVERTSEEPFDGEVVDSLGGTSSVIAASCQHWLDELGE
jgi:hypothetical protein